MRTKDFSFEVPEELIAQNPPNIRGGSRLLVCSCQASGRKKIYHSQISQLGSYLPKPAVIVFNNSKVRKARILSSVPNGGKLEVLFLRTEDGINWEALINKTKKRKTGQEFLLPGNVRAKITDKRAGRVILTLSNHIDDTYFDQYGHVPLPPYIKREDTREDEFRYQTVFAETPGSVAAPTAGLHFTDELLETLKKQGFILCSITLHVGVGTFQPIRTEKVEDHTMHREEYEISEETAQIIMDAQRNNVPIIAVGTTTVRTLESVWLASPAEGSSEGISYREILPGKGETELFIYPGFRFNLVNGMVTNFHTPESSLFVMVSAFAGKEHIEEVYQEAIQKKYRFFSYGDAMLLLR